MKTLIVVGLTVALLLLGFALLDLAVVVSQYFKHLGEPYDLYSWLGVGVVGGTIALSCFGGWCLRRKSKGLPALWQKLASLQFILSLSALVTFAFVFMGPFGVVR